MKTHSWLPLISLLVCAFAADAVKLEQYITKFLTEFEVGAVPPPPSEVPDARS